MASLPASTPRAGPPPRSLDALLTEAEGKARLGVSGIMNRNRIVRITLLVLIIALAVAGLVFVLTPMAACDTSKAPCKNAVCGWRTGFRAQCPCDDSLRQQPPQLEHTALAVGCRGNYTGQETWWRVVSKLDGTIAGNGRRLVQEDGAMNTAVAANANQRFAATREALDVHDFLGIAQAHALGLAALHTHSYETPWHNGFSWRNVSLVQGVRVAAPAVGVAARTQGVVRLTVTGDRTTRRVPAVRRIQASSNQCLKTLPGSKDGASWDDTCRPPQVPQVLEVDAYTRVGAALTSTKVYGPGRFEVLARVPPTTAATGRGYAFALWMEHYEAVSNQGDAQFVVLQPGGSAADTPSRDDSAAAMFPPQPQPDVYGFTAARCSCACKDQPWFRYYNQQDVAGNGNALALLGMPQFAQGTDACKGTTACPAASAAAPSCDFGGGAAVVNPVTIHRHAIRMMTPAATALNTDPDLYRSNGDVTANPADAMAQHLGWNTLGMETWVADNREGDKTTWMRQVQATRSAGATFHSSPTTQGDGEFHKYGFEWHVPGDATQPPYVDFFFDDKFLYRQTCFVPTRPGRFCVGAFVSETAGDGSAASRGARLAANFDTVHVDIAAVRITPDTASRIVDYPQLWMQCPVAALGSATMCDVRTLDGQLLDCTRD